MQKFADNVVAVLYDFQYTAKDKRLINVKQGEKLYLINKTNKDWWQVIRSCEERPFFVPAQYVVERSKLQGTEQLKQQQQKGVEYQNLDFLKLSEPEISKTVKPVPKARTQIHRNINDKAKTLADKKFDNDVQCVDNPVRINDNNNRMKNSYNLKNEHPRMERKQSVPLHKRKPLELGRTMSRSLEKLAEEIKFEPKSRKESSSSMTIELKSKKQVCESVSVVESVEPVKLEKDNVTVRATKEMSQSIHVAGKVGPKFSKGANDVKPVKEPVKKVESEKLDKGIFRNSMRGKSKDAGVILNEKDAKVDVELKSVSQKPTTFGTPVTVNQRKPPTKSRGNFFSSFKRQKQAYVLSTSWEGLDKIDDWVKPTTNEFGLQRSRTFMFPEKPKPKKRLDAYNVMTFSTFKQPKEEEGEKPQESRIVEDEEREEVETRRDSQEAMFSCENDPMRSMLFAGRKTSLVRKGRVDASSARLRVPASPPPDVLPLRDLGDGWGEFHSSDGRLYYYNRITGERNLKPPRRSTNAQHGSKDSIASDFSSPVRSSPSESPKFPSGTSLDRLPFDGARHRSRSSLDRLTPIEIPTLDHRLTPKSSPSFGSDRMSPLDNLPSDGEALELSDHVMLSVNRAMAVPKGYREEIEKGKDGQSRRCYINIGTHEKYDTWPPRSTSSKKILEKQLNSYKKWLELQYGGLDKPFCATVAMVDFNDVISAQDDTHGRLCERPAFLKSPYLRRVSCDVFDEILQVIHVEIKDIDEMMAIFDNTNTKASPLEAENLMNLVENMKQETGEFEDDVVAKGRNIFDDGRKREKPPVPPRRKHKTKISDALSTKTASVDVAEEDEHKNEYEARELLLLTLVTETSKNRRKSSLNRKASLHLAADEGKFDDDEDVDTQQSSNSPDNTSDSGEQVVRKSEWVSVKDCLGELNDRLLHENEKVVSDKRPGESCEISQSRPITVKECLRNWEQTLSNENEIQFKPKDTNKLVDIESAISVSKSNPSSIIEDFVKNVESENPLHTVDENTKIPDTSQEGKDKSQYAEVVEKREKPPVPTRKNLEKVSSVVLEENLIIEWSSSLDGFHEPTVLESKGVPLRHPSVTSLDSEEGEIFPIGEDMGVRSNSWSHARDLPLCNRDLKDWCEDDVVDDIDTDESGRELDRSAVGSSKTLETLLESIPGDNDDLIAESASNDDLIDVSVIESISEKESGDFNSTCSEEFGDASLNQFGLSKSMDSVNESVLCKKTVVVDKALRVPKNVATWLSDLRYEVSEEEDFTEWYACHNSDDLVYFYKENSNDSTWQLPEVNQDVASTSGELYRIQRSATESAIPDETVANSIRLRKSGALDKAEGARGRASKTQSMIFDGKNFPLPATAEYRHCGTVNRTRFGKKVKKCWITTFAVLFHDSINFYKEEKYFRQKIAAPRTSISHSLENAVIEPAGSLSKKKNCFKISLSPDGGILIQTDKKEDADIWFSLIKQAIDTSPPSPGPSLPKVIRTKSLKVNNSSRMWSQHLKQSLGGPRRSSLAVAGGKGRKKDPRRASVSVLGFAQLSEELMLIAKTTRGSIEDITSVGGGENKNKISELLKKFILRRPSSDALRLKGILKDEPVFGCSLEPITAGRNPRIPAFVQRCIEVIESTEENMKTDGLYRASGNLSQVQKIRLQVDQNNLAIMDQEEDVHVLSGSLKLFFRELKEPLIPFSVFKKALEASRVENKTQKIKKLRNIMNSLPPPNRDTLNFLLVHLWKVQSYKEFNRMHIANLAIVFGPTLVWGDEDTSTMALDLMQQNLVIECLLLEFENIFPKNGDAEER